MKKRRSGPLPAIQLLDKGILRLESDGEHLVVPYRLARSRRARYMRLTINRHNEVVLTLPSGCSLERGMRFIRTKTEWLRRHLLRLAPPETLYDFLKASGYLAVSGRKLFIDWKVPFGVSFLNYNQRSGTVTIGFDPGRHDEAQLKGLLRQFASETLPRRTELLAARQKLSVNKISVRDQISRWGSCSVKRNISLNWRLLLLPPEINDYVIWHELAHLIEMNHSDRYWKVLERFYPGARAHDDALSEITNRIMAIGRTLGI